MFATLTVEAAIAGVGATPSALFLNTGQLDTGALAADSWTDITPYVRLSQDVVIQRGATRFDATTIRYDPSTLVVQLDNSDGRFDPTNLTGPYAAAGITKVTPMKGVRVSATYNGVTYPLFTGYADSWVCDYPDGADSTCALRATDGQKVLANFNGAAVGSVGAGETTGQRIHRILDNAGWAATDRLIQPGATTVQATTLAQAAWAEILLTSDTEIGGAYIDAAGRVVFRDRSDITANPRSTTVQTTFGDGPGEIEYESLSITYDDSQLANYVRAARTGGVEQVAQDPVSQLNYLTQTLERTDLTMQTDTEAANWAGLLLYQNKEPEMRASRVVVSPVTDADYAACLGADFGDRVAVIRRPLARAGGAFQQQCFIRGVTHTVGVNTWETVFAFQSATKWAFFTLDDPALGVLDSNALTY